MAPNHYWVEFISDPIWRERLVLEEFQIDAGRMLAVLTALWRAGMTAEASFDDFFPEEPTQPE